MKREITIAALPLLAAACGQPSEAQLAAAEPGAIAQGINNVADEMQAQAPPAISDEEIRQDAYHDEFADDGWGTNDSGYSEGWAD